MTAGSRVATRAVVLLVALLIGTTACSAGSGPSAQDGTQITDVLGRQVTVRTPTPRILLGGSRMLYTTALLNPQDPAANVVGWPNDLQQNDQDTYRQYTARFPQVARVPVLGQLPNGSFSTEQALELRPDVFVVSAANFKIAQDAGTVDQLQRAGIPTVVTDYFVDPLKNTVPSLRIFGQLFGKQAEAQRYIDYYQAGMQMVRSRLDAAKPAPTPTFLWRAPGYYDCCSTFGKTNLGQLVTWAGGTNFGDTLNVPQGTVSPETILKVNPAVIIATGADWAPGGPATPGSFVSLGYDEAPDKAQQQLHTLIDRQAGFDTLAAVRDRRVHVLWHHFYDSPYNVLAMQWFAKWLHPEVFGDVDPAAGLRDLHTKFLPVAPSGTFSADLQ